MRSAAAARRGRGRRNLTDREQLLRLEHLAPSTEAVVLVEGPWDAAAVTARSDARSLGVATNGTTFTRAQATRLAGLGLPVVVEHRRAHTTVAATHCRQPISISMRLGRPRARELRRRWLTSD